MLSVSNMTYWAAPSRRRLCELDSADRLFEEIYQYSLRLETLEPKIDYFATSLPPFSSLKAT